MGGPPGFSCEGKVRRPAPAAAGSPGAQRAAGRRPARASMRCTTSSCATWPCTRVRRELRVDGVDRVEDVARAERGQHRLERVVERQQVRGAAAGAEREHGLAAQRVLRQQVEEGLQQAAVRGLVDGRGDHHQARRGHLLAGAADGRIVEVGAHQRRGGQVAQHDLAARGGVGKLASTWRSSAVERELADGLPARATMDMTGGVELWTPLTIGTPPRRENECNRLSISARRLCR